MVSAILVAAGRGTRMGPNVDKLFLELDHAPVLVHTWRRLVECPEVDHIIAVCRGGMESAFRELVRDYGLQKSWDLVEGGAERQDSVWNGLQAVPKDTEIVAIQDGARPCTSPELIRATIVAAREFGAAVAAQRVTDTIKESKDGHVIDRTVDRSVLWSVQTPQTFRLPLIRQALQEVRRRGATVTDDTAACEFIGHPVRLVASARPNPKVTRPEDLHMIELLLQQQR